MSKTILITGSTDGIGLEAAKRLLKQDHTILLHGRNQGKLDSVKQELSAMGQVESYLADLSSMEEVKNLATQISSKYPELDVLINNAGILNSPQTETQYGLDIRFMVNTFAPYMLTKLLLPILQSGRVINLSSAAQASVNLDDLSGKNKNLSAMNAYSQSKLAIIMWTKVLAKELANTGTMITAINPGSLLGTKMVREGFGMKGKDIGIGADILVRASVSEEFEHASGEYYDNDSRRFAQPHQDALDESLCVELVREIETIISGM